jgi:hypothetical protein
MLRIWLSLLGSILMILELKKCTSFLVMQSTLAGGLQGVYIGGSNDPYPNDSIHSAQDSGDGPRSARQKLAFTL